MYTSKLVIIFMKRGILIIGLFMVFGLIISGSNLQQVPKSENEPRDTTYCLGNCKQPGGCGEGCECVKRFFGVISRCAPTQTQEETE